MDCVVCVIIETGRLRGDCVVAACWLRGGCVCVVGRCIIPASSGTEAMLFLIKWLMLILSWDVVCCGVSALRVPCAACVPALRVLCAAPCAACIVVVMNQPWREEELCHYSSALSCSMYDINTLLITSSILPIA